MSIFSRTFLRGCCPRVVGLSLLAVATTANAAAINFSGPLSIIDTDLGTAVYSGVAVGTTFTGTIDDVTFSGSITDGTTGTSFGCCIAAGGLGLTNNIVLFADDADFLNQVAGAPLFSENDVVDSADIEGDATTAGDGRIEVGVSYILRPDAFDDENPVGNYPFDPADILLMLFFIVEENSSDVEIYNAVGRVDVMPIPLPAAAYLFGSGILALFAASRRKAA